MHWMLIWTEFFFFFFVAHSFWNDEILFVPAHYESASYAPENFQIKEKTLRFPAKMSGGVICRNGCLFVNYCADEKCVIGVTEPMRQHMFNQHIIKYKQTFVKCH